MTVSAKTTSKTEKKLRIIETSTQLILENGFSNTSINLIQKEAEISKGLIYYHFKDKDDLGIAVLEYLLSKEFQDFENFQSIIPELPPSKIMTALDNYLLKLFASTMQDRGVIQVIIDLLLNLKEQSSKQRVRELYLRYLKKISNFLELLGVDNPQVNAKLVLSILDGLVYLNLALDETLTEVESKIIVQAMKCMFKLEDYK